MKQKIEPKDYEWWNELKKDVNGESDVRAGQGDITAQAGNLACLCQRRNDFNNIVIQALKPDIKNPWFMLFFLRYLHEVHNVQYVRIECAEGRYDFFLRIARNPRFEKIVNDKNVVRQVIYLDLAQEIAPIKKWLYKMP